MGTTLHSTMAYNPAANGMVERVHHSLKAALMARCTNEKWKEQLPWVLLGIRTAPKANDNASPAEKVYRETLAVPGEFFPPLADGANTLLLRLSELAERFAPCHKTFTNKTITYSPPAVHSCGCVFVRVDVRCPPLTRPYRGPHRVIRRTSKAFLLNIHRQEDWITIDRLKPAFLLGGEVCKEAGRRPRVPLQYLPADAPSSPPRRPRKRTQPSPGVNSTSRPQFSRSRGPLCLPQRLHD
ncbi:uncharacterized protein [Macrobrachium rosenbergii]|uniref:uncharacterized protein n=1 Tax=Macrobrachium rosenbergii TaxID=79674 RepID=UPI0034D568F1